MNKIQLIIPVIFIIGLSITVIFEKNEGYRLVWILNLWVWIINLCNYIKKGSK